METNKITYHLIEQYLQGGLDEKSMYELERKALDDPFLADALEGYKHTKSQAGPQLSILQRQLEERIALQQEKKNTYNFTWQRISIASAASLLFISASILFWMKGSRPEHAEVPKERKVEVTLTNPDSLNELTATYSFKSDGIQAQFNSASAPLIGWREYQKYLNSHFKFSGLNTQKVVITFNINDEGSTSSFNILEGPNNPYSKELIQTIKNGPKWRKKAKGKAILSIELKK